MLKPLITGSTAIVFLLAGSLSVHAEAPQTAPLVPQQFAYVPPNHPLIPYAATDSVPVLKAGSKGQAVVDIQQFLKQKGLYTGAIDGAFGQESQLAVRRFQQQANLTPDGIVGIETWKAMLSSSIS